MLRYIFILLLVLSPVLDISAQMPAGNDTTVIPVHGNLRIQDSRPYSSDSVPKPIPDFLSPSLFIPRARLTGLQPWIYAPLSVPQVHVIAVSGYNGIIGAGEYTRPHQTHFFSAMEGRNIINIPQLYVTRQMFLGNALKIFSGFYFMSGILYGAQMGEMGNNWGMGTREGFIYQPSSLLSVTLWSQYFQSLSVYTPVLYPRLSRSGAAIVMPATPEVFSFGVQASFVVGEFIIGIGTSVSPVPYQDRHHSEPVGK